MQNCQQSKLDGDIIRLAIDLRYATNFVSQFAEDMVFNDHNIGLPSENSFG